MKKIVSLLLAVAVVLCLGITSFATDAAPFSFEEAAKEIAVGTGTEDVTLVLNIDIDNDFNAFMMALQLTFDDKNVSIKDIDSSAFLMPVSAGGTDVAGGLVTYMDDNAVESYTLKAGTTYSIPITVTVNNTVEADYTIGFDPNNTMIVDGGENILNDLATYPTATISVKAAAPAVKTIEKSDYKIVAEATTVDGKTTDTQIGAAVGIKFTKPAATLLPKMIWAVETSAGRKYSKAVPFDLSDVDGTITVAATFHNGIHENSFGVAEVAPLSITGVDAIFTDGTDDYFTNAADKGAKKAPASVE